MKIYPVKPDYEATVGATNRRLRGNCGGRARRPCQSGEGAARARVAGAATAAPAARLRCLPAGEGDAAGARGQRRRAPLAQREHRRRRLARLRRDRSGQADAEAASSVRSKSQSIEFAAERGWLESDASSSVLCGMPSSTARFNQNFRRAKAFRYGTGDPSRSRARRQTASSQARPASTRRE